MLRGRAQWIWAVALSLRLLGTAQCADLQYMDDQSGYVELHCDCDKDWTLTQDSNANFRNNTESALDDPNAWFRFTYTGTTFTIHGVRTRARGGFMCMIDQGDWLNIGEGYDPDVADGVSGKSQAIMIGPRDMKQGEHTIVVRNWGGDPRINDGKGSLAFDYITYTGDPQPPLTTSEPSTSTTSTKTKESETREATATTHNEKANEGNEQEEEDEESSTSTTSSSQTSSLSSASGMISVPKSQKVQSSEGAEPENEDQSEEEDDNDDTSEEEDDTGDDGDHTDARSQESDEKQSKNGPDTTAIASGAAIGTAALLVAILGVTCCLRRRSSQSPKDATPSWVYSAEGHSSMGDSLSRMVIQKPQQVPSVTSGHGSAARRHEQPQPPPSSASGGGSIDQWAREQSLISRSEEIHDDETEFPQSRHRPASYASATEFLGPPRSEWEAPLDSRTEIGMANRSTLAPTALSKFEPRQSMPMGEAAPWR